MSSGGKGKLEFTRQVPNFLKGLVQEQRSSGETQPGKRKAETGEDEDFKPVIVDLNETHKTAAPIPTNVAKEATDSAGDKSASKKPTAKEEKALLSERGDRSLSASHDAPTSEIKVDSKKRVAEQVKPKANKKLLSFDADNEE